MEGTVSPPHQSVPVSCKLTIFKRQNLIRISFKLSLPALVLGPSPPADKRVPFEESLTSRGE